MVNERFPDAEPTPELSEVLTEVDNYLERVLPKGGVAYKRIRFPLMFMPHYDGEIPIVGYRRDRSGVGYTNVRIAKKPEVTPETLNARGLIRTRGSSIDYRGWYANLHVTEYRDAELKGFRLKPKTDERLIQIEALPWDSEGRTISDRPNETILISSQHGLLEHTDLDRKPIDLSVESEAEIYSLILDWLRQEK